MGLQDRDYMRERGRKDTTKFDAVIPSLRSNFLNLFKDKSRLFFLLLVVSLVTLAATSNDSKIIDSCKFENFSLDANHDGQFTYRDLGTILLKITTYPRVIVFEKEIFSPIIHFLELRIDDCHSLLAHCVNGLFFLLAALLVTLAGSLILLLMRKIAKYIVFDVIKISPFGKVNSLIFHHLYPRFVWIVKPIFLIIFAAGLTCVWIYKKSNSSKPVVTSSAKVAKNSESSKEGSRALQSKETKANVSLYRENVSDLKRLDVIAASVTADQASSVEKLASSLTKGLQTDLEKTYVIYRWVTANIDYDVDAFFSNNLRGIGSAPVVLKNRKAVCDGYSELMVKLGQAAGLKIEKVSGYAKGYGYSIGEATTKSNHAWNAVQINGAWYLLDSTWDAGFINKESRKFVKKRDEYSYFLTNPNHFIYSHYPELRKWQLLDNEWDRDEFFSKVSASERAFRLGLKFDNNSVAAIKATQPEYEFDFKSPATLTGALSKNDAKVRGSWTMPVFDEGGHTRLLVSAPDKGSYTFNVFAANDPNANSFSSLLEYKISFSNTGIPYPETYGRYFSSKVVLKSPLQGSLKANSSVFFKLSINAAQSVVVYVNGKPAQTLRRDGKVFSGEVPVTEGEAIVYAQFDEGGKLDGLLKYQIR